MSDITHEEIVELQKKFSEVKSSINNAFAVMETLSHMSQRRRPIWRFWTAHPGARYSKKLARVVLAQSPILASSLTEFAMALREKAGKSTPGEAS